LADGELREIEDIAGCQRPVIRCPRHNRLFDVSTGEGQGNYDTLQRFPAKFIREYGAFYVAISPTPSVPLGCAQEAAALTSDCATQLADDMDVDMVQEPVSKKTTFGNANTYEEVGATEQHDVAFASGEVLEEWCCSRLKSFSQKLRFVLSSGLPHDLPMHILGRLYIASGVCTETQMSESYNM